MSNVLGAEETHNSADFCHPAERWGARRLMVAILCAGVGLALSGCALSMSEFAQKPDKDGTADPVVLTSQPDFDTGNTANPPPTPEALAAQAEAVAGTPTAMAAPAGGTENTQQTAPRQSDSKLLTPEEKARVIAELEALARGQSAQQPASQTSNECDPNAAQPLDPDDPCAR